MIRRNFLKTLFGGAAAVAVGGVAVAEAADAAEDKQTMDAPVENPYLPEGYAENLREFRRCADELREMCPAQWDTGPYSIIGNAIEVIGAKFDEQRELILALADQRNVPRRILK